jgi:hypothetical protein
VLAIFFAEIEGRIGKDCVNHIGLDLREDFHAVGREKCAQACDVERRDRRISIFEELSELEHGVLRS